MGRVLYDPAAEEQKQAKEKTRGTGLLSDIDAFVRGAADMITLGSMDEISAYLSSKTGIGGESGEYEKNLDEQRAIDEFDKEHNPYARTGGQVAGGVALAAGGGAPLSARAATSGLVARGAAGAAEGAVGGAGYGFGSGEGGFQNRIENAKDEALTGAAFGGAGGAVAPYVERAGRAVVGAFRGAPEAAADAIPAARAEMARLLGVDPAQISDEVAADFAQRAGQAGAAPTAAANEFNIPLTRGQATGDVGQQAFEEAARNEARGAAAGTRMRDFDTRQRAAIGADTERFAEQAAGAPVATRSVQDLSADTLSDIERAHTRSLRGVDEAYNAARGSGTAVTREAVEQAPSAVRRGVQDSGVIVNETTAPYATRALQQLDEFAQMRGPLVDRAATGAADPAATIAGLTLDGVEKMRQQLLKARKLASTPDDIRGMRAVINAFDDWLDDAGSNGLLHGSDEGIELFKRARAARTEHGRRFESARHQVDDDAGRLLEKMISKDVTETEVANALYGAARTGEGGTSVRLAKRLKTIMGADSPEFGRIRQAAWEKMIRNDRGEILGNQALAEAIVRATSGKGSPFVRELYSAEQIGRMRRFATTLRQTVPDPRATNPSKSSYGNARAVADFAGAMFGTAVTGNPIVGLFARNVPSNVVNAYSAVRAGRATRGVQPQAPPVGPGQRAPAGLALPATAIEDPEERPLPYIRRPGVQR